MSVRLATALGLVRGLFSLSLFGETSVSETNKEEGSVSSLFLLPMGVIAPLLWYADKVWKAAAHDRL